MPIFIVIYKILLTKVQTSLKMFNLNRKKTQTKSNSEVVIVDINSSTEIPKELNKNKWLYPADEFVEKWKKPKIYKSKTFEL
jgi:hypothetical protein